MAIFQDLSQLLKILHANQRQLANKFRDRRRISVLPVSILTSKEGANCIGINGAALNVTAPYNLILSTRSRTHRLATQRLKLPISHI